MDPGAPAGGRDRQTSRRAVPARCPVTGLDQDQAPAGGGRGDRWLAARRAGDATARAVLVGIPAEAGRLLFVGSVGSGFANAARRWPHATPPVGPGLPFTAGLGLPRGTPVRFTHPELHAEVEFLEPTPAGRLRHPVWRGLRD
ncbi:hypothetical protein ACFQ0M_48425 [Kitasatospora aburaviensis]